MDSEWPAPSQAQLDSSVHNEVHDVRVRLSMDSMHTLWATLPPGLSGALQQTHLKAAGTLIYPTTVLTLPPDPSLQARRRSLKLVLRLPAEAADSTNPTQRPTAPGETAQQTCWPRS